MKRKKFVGDVAFKTIMFVIMTLFSLSFAVVLLWMALSSFRESANFNREPFKLFEFSNYTFNSWKTAFTYKEGRGGTDMFGMIYNSVLLVVIHVALSISIPAITGYVCAKYSFCGKKFLVNFMIIAMVIPTVGSLSATYKFMNDIKLYDSFFGIFLMSAGGFGFGFLMFRNFFASIPWEFAESAFLDGAGHFRVFIQIMYPQARGIVTSIAIMSFISQWNDYFTPYMYLPSHPTVALGVNNIYEKFVKSGQQYPVVFAAMTFMSAVILVVYSLFSKTIMESMSAGGLKG